MPNNRLPLEGKTFGLLTVKEFAGSGAHGHSIWECECRCGGTARVTGRDLLRTNDRASCGCLRGTKRLAKKTQHGLIDTPVYRCWAHMLQRCLNPNEPAYKNYGARGISVCSRWMEFPNFFEDMGHPPEGLSIERNDNDGPYSPDNCRWASKTEQMRNRRNSRWVEHDGRRQLMSEWCAELKITPNTLLYRLANWPIERALTERNNHG